MLALFAIVALLELTAALAGFRLAWPVSDSLPRGLYVLVAGPRSAASARVCLPPAIAAYALARGIERRGGDCRTASFRSAKWSRRPTCLFSFPIWPPCL